MSRTRTQRNLVLLGFSLVGKTSVCTRWIKNIFSERYEPTYEFNFNKTVRFRGEDIKCVVKDTEGLNGESVLRSEYALGSHGFLLVYNVTSSRSLDVLKSIHDKLVNLTGTMDVPCLLVGNKADLGHMRQVSYAEGAALAAQWGCAFVECSAKTGHNIDRVFLTVLDQIESKLRPQSDGALSLCCAPCACLGRCWSGVVGSGSSDMERGSADAGYERAEDKEESTEWGCFCCAGGADDVDPSDMHRGTSHRSSVASSATSSLHRYYEQDEALDCPSMAVVLLLIVAGSLTSVSLGIVLGVRDRVDGDTVMCIVLCVLGGLSSLLAVFGTSALRSDRPESLVAFASGAMALTAFEFVTFAVAFWQRKLDVLRDDVLVSTFVLAMHMAVFTFAAMFAWLRYNRVVQSRRDAHMASYDHLTASPAGVGVYDDSAMSFLYGAQRKV